MSTQPASALSPAYTCKICRKTLTITGPPIIGENLPQKLGRVAQLLGNHVAQEHQREMLGIGIAAQQVQGWLLTEQFDHNDAELHKVSNDARLQFRRNTRRVNISDEMIERQVQNHIPFDSADRDAVITLLKTMRDVIEEEPSKPAA